MVMAEIGIKGISVGHYSDCEGLTGCTVVLATGCAGVLAPGGVLAVGEVAGGAAPGGGES